MIGNDIPGLRYTVEYNRMGVCVPKMNTKYFAQAIQNIADNYNTFSSNAVKFNQNDNKSEVVRLALKK